MKGSSSSKASHLDDLLDDELSLEGAEARSAEAVLGSPRVLELRRALPLRLLLRRGSIPQSSRQN